MPLKGHVIQQHRGSYMKLIFTFHYHTGSGKNQLNSKDFVIDGSARVRFKFLITEQNDVEGEMASMRDPSAKASSVEMHAFCDSPEFSEIWDCNDNWTEWIPIGIICNGIKYDESWREGRASAYYMFMIHINVNNVAIRTPGTFMKIHEDSKFTDFNLCVAGGEVALHKVFLSAHSPIFNAWLSDGKWEGQAEGAIDLKEITVQTLQDLKEYLYLRRLPEEGLLTLLLFASHYSISSLKKDCIAKLLRDVDSENMYSYLEFACAHDIPELAFAVAQRTPDDVVHDVAVTRKEEQLLEELVEIGEAAGQGSVPVPWPEELWERFYHHCSAKLRMCVCLTGRNM